MIGSLWRTSVFIKATIHIRTNKSLSPPSPSLSLLFPHIHHSSSHTSMNFYPRSVINDLTHTHGMEYRIWNQSQLADSRSISILVACILVARSYIAFITSTKWG